MLLLLLREMLQLLNNRVGYSSVSHLFICVYVCEIERVCLADWTSSSSNRNKLYVISFQAFHNNRQILVVFCVKQCSLRVLRCKTGSIIIENIYGKSTIAHSLSARVIEFYQENR